jgi:SMC interacting uncharacterized protein involved in chromosome segregation
LLAFSLLHYVHRKDHILDLLHQSIYKPTQATEIVKLYQKPLDALQRALVAYTISAEDVKHMGDELSILLESMDPKRNFKGYLSCVWYPRKCEAAEHVKELRTKLDVVDLEKTKQRIEDTLCHLCRDAIDVNQRLQTDMEHPHLGITTRMADEIEVS